MHPTTPGGEPAEPTRRGNGLSASEWGALVDVDPRLSDALLTRLAGAEVAAHVEPAGATTDPVSRAGLMPARPLHRLWVDVARADAARAVVEEAAAEVVSDLQEHGGPPGPVEQFLHAVPRGASGRVLRPPRLAAPDPAPEPAAGSPTTSGGSTGTEDSDAAWQAIVEGFARTPDDPVPPWPVEEDLDTGPRRRREEPAADPPPPGRPARRRSDRAADLPGWVEPDPVPDEGHYEPPPPPPTPSLAPRTIAAVAALTLGVLVMFSPGTLGLGRDAASWLLGIALTVGGAGALVYWMRDAPGPDDGPDDGAVV